MFNMHNFYLKYLIFQTLSGKLTCHICLMLSGNSTVNDSQV